MVGVSPKRATTVLLRILGNHSHLPSPPSAPPHRPLAGTVGRVHFNYRTTLLMQTPIDSHGLALVPSQLFLNRMVQHWSQISEGKMVATAALKEAWAIFALQCRQLIINNASDNPMKPSVVLPLPTGSGKTEGTCVYAALQAETNVNSASRPVGVLIITRLIKDAERLVASIN